MAGINSGNQLKTGSSKSFIGPIVIKNKPSNFTSQDYKKAASFDYNNDGTVDYERLSANPFYRIEDYISNNATDEQILEDIKLYKQKYKYSLNAENDGIVFSQPDSMILDNIKKIIEEENKKSSAAITAADPSDVTAKISDKPNERFTLPSSKNWYSKDNISDTYSSETIDLNKLDYIDDKTKAKANEMQEDITEQRRILASFEDFYSFFKHNINDKREYINTHSDTSFSVAPLELSITVAGVTYSYTQVQGDNALNAITDKLESQKQIVYDAEKELWDYKMSAIQSTDYYKKYIASLDVDSLLVSKTIIKGYNGYSGHMSKSQMEQYTKTRIETAYLIGESNYKYMTTNEKQFYCYLLQKQNKSIADSYLNSLQGDINSRQGLENALKFVSRLDLSDPREKEVILSHFKGLSDGIDQFFHGIEVWFTGPSYELTPKQYEVMYITALLAQSNANIDLGFLGEFNVLEKVYTISVSEGNMIPSMIAGTLGSIAGFPELGALTMFASVAGNSAEASYQQGYDLWSSWFYGLMAGASEATLERLLGGIPGISKMDDLGLLAKAVNEGFEESLQEILDPYLRYMAFGEDPVVDWKKVVEAGIDGIILAAYLNGGEVAINSVAGEISVSTKFLQEKYDTIKALEDSGVEIDYARITEDGYLDSLQNPGINSAVKSIFSKFKKTQLDFSDVKSVVDNYKGNIKTAFREILYNSFQKSNAYESKLAARDLIDYLESQGYSREDSALYVAEAWDEANSKRGFDFQKGNNGTIDVWVQKGFNMSSINFNANDVLNYISTLPSEIQQLVKGLAFYDSFNPYDYYWESHYNMTNFQSAATGGDGIINFYYGCEFSPSTISHEIGHTYDTKYYENKFGIKGRISESQLWLDAMDADAKYNNLNGVTEYARNSNSPVEDFAESFSLYYTNPSALDNFPNRKRVIESILPKSQTNIKSYNYTDITVDLQAADAFDAAFDALIDKYGVEEAIKYMNHYLKTGDLNAITRYNNARQKISLANFENIKRYVKTINHGSLDVRTLLGG